MRRLKENPDLPQGVETSLFLKVTTALIYAKTQPGLTFNTFLLHLNVPPFISLRLDNNVRFTILQIISLEAYKRLKSTYYRYSKVGVVVVKGHARDLILLKDDSRQHGKRNRRR